MILRYGRAQNFRDAILLSKMSANEDDDYESLKMSFSRRNKRTASVFQATTKAAFYDKMLTALKEGDDEDLAIEKAKDAAKGLEDEFNSLELKQSIAAKTSFAGTLKAMSSNVKSGARSSESLAKQNQIEELNSGDEEDMEWCEFEEESEDEQEVQEGSTATFALTKLKTAITKLSFLGAIKRKKDDPPEFVAIRETNRKLLMVIDQYDQIMENTIRDHQYQLSKSYEEIMQQNERYINNSLTAYYERLISHSDCKTQITNLSKENEILKEELQRTMDVHTKLRTELIDLKMYKSNAETEIKMMSSKLAKRRIECQMLRKRNAMLQMHDRDDPGKSNKEGNESQEQTCLESSDYQSGPEGLVQTQNEMSDINQTAENTDGENDSVADDEICSWYERNGTHKPKWNISTTTNLLNKKGPFSIMHMIDVDDAVSEEEDEKESPSKLDKNGML